MNLSEEMKLEKEIDKLVKEMYPDAVGKTTRVYDEDRDNDGTKLITLGITYKEKLDKYDLESILEEHPYFLELAEGIRHSIVHPLSENDTEWIDESITYYETIFVVRFDYE